jgi:mono/diheme cytochrome c family protein
MRAALVALAAGNVEVRAQEPASGEALFRQKCTVCHPAQRAMEGVAKLPAADRAARLEKFLASHFAPDAAQRKAIAEYLLAASTKP